MRAAGYPIAELVRVARDDERDCVARIRDGIRVDTGRDVKKKPAARMGRRGTQRAGEVAEARGAGVQSRRARVVGAQ